MGLDFTRPNAPQPLQGQAPAAPQEEESYQQYDISADRQMMTQTLVNSPEVDALASQIEVYNLESIVTFGADAAEEDLQVLRRGAQQHEPVPAGRLQRRC